MGTNTNSLTQLWADKSLDAAWHRTPPELHIAFIVGVAVAVHLVVKIVRAISEWSIRQSHAKKNPLMFVTQQPKFVTVLRLIVSGATFVVYFLAGGFVLHEEFKMNLSAYLASASVIGLAISFGSQGLVQDVVMGMTMIFSNTMDVGEIVDLSGTVGRIEEIGLRFTKLINFYDQEVFVPNRNIANVSRFPHGGLFAYIDLLIPSGADAARFRQTVSQVASGLHSQFHEIILEAPAIGAVQKAEGADWRFLRVKLKIWPGQQGLVETTFRQQFAAAMKGVDANYADWMIAIIYRATVALDDAASPRSTGV